MHIKSAAVSKELPKHAFIDLLGTVIHHRTGRVLALMDCFFRGLHQGGWKINILTSFSHDEAKRLVRQQDLPDDVIIMSSSGMTKGQIVSEMIRDLGEGKYLYMDDKPEGLASVRNACGDRVRIIGFVGSHQYTPALSDWCFHNGVELALSVSDLCEGLQVSCDAYPILVDSAERYTEDELFLLIPGLDHPRSAFGETCWLDHRTVLCELFSNRKITNFPALWESLAWITCGECLLKAMIESVIQFHGLVHVDVLGNAYKYNEYLAAAKEFAAVHRKIDFADSFDQAFMHARRGIKNIGVEAENCRISCRPTQLDRLDFAHDAIRRCLTDE